MIGWMMILLSSCIRKYDMDFSDFNDVLTLNAELNPGDSVKILLAYPKPPLTHGDYKMPKDAVIRLYEDDVFLMDVTYNIVDPSAENGLYIAPYFPKPGSKYAIELNYPGYPAITAEQVIPEQVKIGDIAFEEPWENRDSSKTLTSVWTIVDTGEKGYYAIRCWYRLRQLVRLADGRDSVTTSRPNAIRKVYVNNSFRDFNGATAFELDANRPVTVDLNILGKDILESDSILAASLSFEVQKLTLDAYLYRKTYKESGDNYGEPRTVHNNLKGGLGIFSAITSDRKTVVVK